MTLLYDLFTASTVRAATHQADEARHQTKNVTGAQDLALEARGRQWILGWLLASCPLRRVLQDKRVRCNETLKDETRASTQKVHALRDVERQAVHLRGRSR